MTSGRLAALSVVIALGAIAAYVLLFRVAAVRIPATPTMLRALRAL